MEEPTTPTTITNKPFQFSQSNMRPSEIKSGKGYSRKLYLIAKEALSNRMPLSALTMALRQPDRDRNRSMKQVSYSMQSK